MQHRIRSIRTRGRSLMGVLVIGVVTQTASAATPCAALQNFSMAGHRIDIREAHDVPATALDATPFMPAHCRLDGIIDARVGRDGKPYGIGFAVALPKTWNGRFLFQGGGGLNGSVNPPLGAQYAGDRSALARGFAVASTDSGHQGAVFDGSFFQDQQAALDFLYRGVATVTLVAKQITAQHYGKPSDHAYFVGCSTGGREAMMMSQRYPDYFNGIVAGAPAMRTSFSNLGLRHATAALNAIAPLNPEGHPDTRAALSDADRRLVVDGVLEECDALDGRRDGLIFATQKCAFDPGVLACKDGKQNHCLSRAKVEAVRTVMRGPRTSSGRQVYPGYYYDTGIANTEGLAGVLVGPVIPEGRPVGVNFDIDAAWPEAINARSMVGDTHAWTNLSSFRAHGGRLIFLHGVSDPWFSARDTAEYYERLASDNAEVPIHEWSRLFLVPGMGHCGGGERTVDQLNLLDAIVAWVEMGQAPERVIARGKSAPEESRPLCPYPAYARYAGAGDPSDASSYSCER
jgi:pimeloyl-ACP methyl ester carboxylesterase